MRKERYLDELIVAAGKKTKEKDYWLDKLSGELEKTNFPYDFRRTGDFKRRIDVVKDKFSPASSLALSKLSAGSDVRLHIILMSLLIVLLHKYTGENDIIFGTPILKPDIDADFTNTVIVIRIRIENGMIFKELLFEARKTYSDAIKNQGYPIEILIDELGLPFVKGDFPLFDVAILGAGIHEKSHLDHVIPNIIFIFSRAGEVIDFALEYNSYLYDGSTAGRIVNHFKRLVETVLADIEIKLSAVDVLTKEEKKQLLQKFNDTAVPYPKEKTIRVLFEDLVEKTPDNIAVVGVNHSAPVEDEHLSSLPPVSLTYRQLNREAGKLADVLIRQGAGPGAVAALLTDRSIERIVGIFAILKAGGAYLPIDPEYPQSRQEYILRDSNAGLLLISRGLEKKIEKLQNLQIGTLFIEPKPEVRAGRGVPGESEPGRKSPSPSFSDPAYIIYTSGTTGKPKGTLIMNYSVTRLVSDGKHIDLDKNDRVLQLSNYVFDGSVFDIFGALLNGAALVLAIGEKVSAVDKLADLLSRENITVFLVTTALFNALVEHKIESFKNIKKVIFGGEQVSVEHSKKALEYMGKGRILHVYGPSETTVYASYYPIDHIEKKDITVPIGRPVTNTSLFVLDKDLRPVPTGVQGELYIGGDGLARGYINRPELTAAVFSDFMYPKPDLLYKTGDLVRWNFAGDIEFLGRIDSQVKIRGFRIELGEIENRLLSFSGVEEAVVLAREHKNGDGYLCAYVVTKNEVENAGELRDHLSQNMPGYMVPSFFTFLEKMPLTANGKTDRKALPDPGTQAAGVYVAPRDDIEKKMAAIWSEVLGIEEEKIGIDDNFFGLGGHSLNATILISKIRKIFNIEVPLTGVFKTPYIRALAKYLKSSQEERYEAIYPMEKREYYATSSAQKRIYIVQQMEPGNIDYNIYSVLKLAGELDKTRMEEALRESIERCESLRTSFRPVSGEPVQFIRGAGDFIFEVEYYDVGAGHAAPVESESTALPGKLAAGIVDELVESFIRPFDLAKAPLLHSRLLKVADGEYVFLMEMHHIVFDGFSMGIFLKEFIALYEGVTLPSLRIQYKDFSEWQRRSAGDKREIERRKNREEYWLKEFSGEIPLLNIKTDYVRPPVKSIEGNTVFFDIGPEESRLLKKLAEEEESTLFMIMLALFNVLLFKLSGQEDMVIGSFAAGRRHADVEGIIGMFVVTLPLRNFPAAHKRFIEFLSEIKERTLKAFENQEYPFEELVEKVVKSRDVSRNPLYDVGLIWQNLDWLSGKTSRIEKKDFRISPYEYHNKTAKLDLYLRGYERGEKIVIAVEYCTRLFMRETIDRFISYFLGIVSAVIKDPGRLLGDIVKISTEKEQAFLTLFSEDLENE
jgi:amino acid adenylation domain-containing protein